MGIRRGVEREGTSTAISIDLREPPQQYLPTVAWSVKPSCAYVKLGFPMPTAHARALIE